jgi:hypothetical protein
MEWISVERKLPDSGAPVFVATGERITLASWDAGESHFKMMSREDGAMILSGDVTHWTPLPELPQEKHSDWSKELPLCDGVTVESRIGAVPVEYSGKVDQKEYYFRSRGQRWEMIIGDTVDRCVEASLTDRPLEIADFYCAGRYGKERFDAGYMPLEQTEGIIPRCVRLWRAARQDT